MNTTPAQVRGTQGYAAQADELFARYEAVDFARKHEAVRQFLPPAPASVLDIGAGTGADAAWLDARGYRVLAVEPTAEFRARAMVLHPSPSIEWIDDHLPSLAAVMARRARFDLVMLTAVWMHLDETERRVAMPGLSSLMAPGGVLLMTLRHGPVPAGRLMFDVSAEETVGLAQACDLRLLSSVRGESTSAANLAAGVMWSRLAFAARPHAAALA